MLSEYSAPTDNAYCRSWSADSAPAARTTLANATTHMIQRTLATIARSRRSARARRGLDWVWDTKIRRPRSRSRTRGSYREQSVDRLHSEILGYQQQARGEHERGARPHEQLHVAGLRGANLIGHNGADRSEHGQPGRTNHRVRAAEDRLHLLRDQGDQKSSRKPRGQDRENQVGRFGATGLIAAAGGSITRKRTTPVRSASSEIGPSPCVPPMRRIAPSSRRSRD